MLAPVARLGLPVLRDQGRVEAAQCGKKQNALSPTRNNLLHDLTQAAVCS
jgi:hypothetical protein